MVAVPATEIADKQLGDVRAANLVMVGAYLKASGLLKLESAQAACKQVLAERPKLIPLNQKALELGYKHT
jgi:Pyruvate:ferredoxin oxidoreductase and related 2-oxoacid:ferredoxin oxidoreductases, gamma subunit